MTGSVKSTRDAYGEALVEVGAENEDVVVLDADVSKATKTDGFARAFPERFFNCGCAEQNMMGIAAGLALTGKVPFVSTFAVFASCRALDQVRNTIAYPKLNVKIAATHAGITMGADGPSHQSIEDIAIMKAIPNMTVIVPADAVETGKVVRTAAASDGPFYIRLGRVAVPSVTDVNQPFHVGRGVLMQRGGDVTIVACGIMTVAALEAARSLGHKRIRATVIHLPTVKPLDEELIILSAQETGAMVVAEEHTVIGGLGSDIARLLGRHIPVPFEQVGIMDTFAESGEPWELMEKYRLTSEEIVRAVEKVIERKKRGLTPGYRSG